MYVNFTATSNRLNHKILQRWVPYDFKITVSVITIVKFPLSIISRCDDHESLSGYTSPNNFRNNSLPDTPWFSRASHLVDSICQIFVGWWRFSPRRQFTWNRTKHFLGNPSKCNTRYSATFRDWSSERIRNAFIPLTTIDFPRNRTIRRGLRAQLPTRALAFHKSPIISGYGITLIPQPIAARNDRIPCVISCNPGETRQSHPTSAFIRGSVT